VQTSKKRLKDDHHPDPLLVIDHLDLHLAEIDLPDHLLVAVNVEDSVADHHHRPHQDLV
jgi:hypothetical protein